MAEERPVAVRAVNIHKDFVLPHEKTSSLKSFVLRPGARRTKEVQHALKGIDFEIKQGEFFGIIGRNGSGKSTLLKILAGIYQPTKGHVEVNGSLVPFIELGVGFNMELSGRDNVYMNGALLGFSRKEVNDMYDEIVAFAELEKFMDQKLKNYSSGMQVRLAFSIAVRARTEILLIDEVLAVGDSNFQRKCFDYFRQIKAEGKTVIFVSHDIGSVRQFCDRALYIDKGDVIAIGETDEVTDLYVQHQNEAIASQKIVVKKKKVSPHQGNKKATIKRVWLENEKGTEIDNLQSEDAQIAMEVVFNKDVEQPIYGLTMTDLTKQIVYQTNTMWKKIDTGSYKKGDKIEVRFELPNVFDTDQYIVTPAVTLDQGHQILHEWKKALTFSVSKPFNTVGFVQVPHDITVKRKRK